MKLVFYGGGHDFENTAIDRELIALCGNNRPQLTFIPASSYMSHLDFQEFVTQYRKFDIQRFIHFPIDVPFNEVIKQEAFSSDIIHLSGGNTYYFLKYLRESKLMGELKQFVKKGGILTGLSAGAIMMTSNIATAGFPDFDKDDNEENIKNFKSLNLVNFEFFPHYRNSQRYDRELISHSRKIKEPLYACPDGSGIIVEDHQIRFVGRVYCFHEGKKFRIKS
jgi:dipeptidase E